MKKRILVLLTLVSVLMCFFAILVNAEETKTVIEFGARFPGSDEYVTVYTENAESSSHPRINFESGKFYTDMEFTSEVDITTVTGLDFSVAVAHDCQNPVNRITNTKKEAPFVNCTEVKWFTKGFENLNPAMCKDWTSLKHFDFGCATTIDYNCFENTGFTEIVIPQTIKKINNSVFSSCKELTSVVFEGNVASFGIGIFAYCPKITSVDFDNQTVIGDTMFRNSGITSVTIPASITKIGNEAFLNCKSLTSVVFEEGFSGKLGSSAFMGTSALTTLTLVEGITEIPYQCFWSSGTVNGIEKVTLPDSVTKLSGRAFNSSGIKVLEIRETSNLSSITGDAFAGMKSLKSIYLPTGVVISCDNLFQYCYNLESVENFENVKFNISSYGENVFAGGIFYECKALKEIKIPYSVTAISGTAFRYFGLERVYIPASVTSINKGWLDDSNNFPSSVVILYCGGDAQKLLSLTDDGEGNVSSSLKARIESGNVVEYNGLSTDYAQGSIVYNANACDIYFGGAHLNGTEIIYTYIDENGEAGGKKYLSALKVSCPCERNCGSESVIKTIPALFVCLGYSADQVGKSGIVLGFKVNKAAIKEYEKEMNVTLEYGVFAASQSKLGDGDILTESGEASSNNVIKARLNGSLFDVIQIKVRGFVNDTQRAQGIAMGAYVIDSNQGEIDITYLQPGEPEENAKYEFVSYSQIISASTNI